MLLSKYRLLGKIESEWKSYLEYGVKMAMLIAVGVCLVFLFTSLLLLSVEVTPPHLNEADIVRAEMTHAWRLYREHSWGANELAPETLSPSRAADPLVGSRSGLTIVESLDTLHLMGMNTEFKQAETWIAAYFNFTNVSSLVSTAEVSAKLLGGLLSAFSLTEKPVFLFKALQVAEGILAAFETPSGLPAPRVFPFEGPASKDLARHIRLDQMTPLYLEFAFLHRLTGLHKYGKAVEKILGPVLRHLASSMNDTSSGAADDDQKIQGELWTPPSIWDTHTGEPVLEASNAPSTQPPPSSWLTLAEVAIKAHLLVGDRGALRIFRALVRGRLSLDALLGCRLDKQVGAECHFSLFDCRLVETLLLSLGQSRDPLAQRDLAHRLGELCSDSMRVNSKRLTPDALLLKSTRSGDLVVKEADAHYAGQPGPLLAGLLMWSRRRQRRHQKLLSSALHSIAQHMRSPGGYQGFVLTGADQLKPDNRQPSYMLAQTFKYIYMALEPSCLNLVSGDWIFNTAGHLLPVREGQQFGRLREIVLANWGQVRQQLGDMERLRRARRRWQTVEKKTSRTPSASCPTAMMGAVFLATMATAAHFV